MQQHPKPKTYAWNFREVDGAALVLRAISSDSIGVLKLENGQFEFWHEGTCRIRTKSFAILFRGIDRIERNS